MRIGRSLPVSLALAALTLNGCDDPKQRIAALEGEKRSMSAELERLRQQAQASGRELDSCRAHLLALQNETDGLRGQLATPVDLPGEWQPVNGGAMVAIEGSVLFPAGRAELKTSSGNVLEKLASEIKSNFPGKDIYVFGHTDSDPIKKSGWKDNRELSTQRALAVVRQLQVLGLGAQQLAACGWGEHRPVAPNSSQDGKARNRRVEIFAVDPALASK